MARQRGSLQTAEDDGASQTLVKNNADTPFEGTNLQSPPPLPQGAQAVKKRSCTIAGAQKFKTSHGFLIW